MVKNEKFQCPSERGGPENFKNHPTFVPSAIFGGVMASQNMVNFFSCEEAALEGQMSLCVCVIKLKLTFHLLNVNL